MKPSVAKAGSTATPRSPISESVHTGSVTSVVVLVPSKSLSAALAAPPKPPFSVMSRRPSGRKAMAVGAARPVTYAASIQPGSAVPARAATARKSESNAAGRRMCAAVPTRQRARCPARGGPHGTRGSASPGLLPLRLALGVVILDRLADRLHGAADERRAVFRCPVVACPQPPQRALELRHHVAGEELVGAERRLAVRPLVRHQEVGAKPSRLRPQPLDLRHGLPRGADHPVAVGVHGIDHVAHLDRLATTG